MTSFQGHGLIELFYDVFYPLVFIIFLWKYKKYLPKIGKNMSLKDLALVVIIILFLPNTTYAIFELKHLYVFPEDFPDPNTLRTVVFGAITLLGLFSALYSIVTLVRYYATSDNQALFGSLFLCFASGFGAALGLLNLYSWQAITNPVLFINKIGVVIASPTYLGIAILSSLYLYVLTLSILLFQPSQPRPKGV